MKKFAVILLVAVMVALTMAEFSAAQEVQKFEPRSSLFVGIGMFQFTDEIGKEVYGNLPLGRAGFERQVSEHVAVGGSAIYMSKPGTPIVYGDPDIKLDGSSKISFLQFRATARYLFGEEKRTRFCAGGGLGIVKMKETMIMTASYEGESATVSATSEESMFEVCLMLGVDIPINQNKTTFLYVEAVGSTAQIQSEWREQSVDLGGGAFDVGIRFKI